MCNVKKYEKIYEEIKTLQPEDTLQLVLEAETEESLCRVCGKCQGKE